MHIQIALPVANQSPDNGVAVMLIRRALRKWSQDNPRATYTMNMQVDHVAIMFDNAKWVTHWAMTWDAYRGDYHSTAWKRIQIINTE